MCSEVCMCVFKCRCYSTCSELNPSCFPTTVPFCLIQWPSSFRTQLDVVSLKVSFSFKGFFAKTFFLCFRDFHVKE